ncbi:pyruvate kinase [Noviherbaspirillum sp. Root189]|uniref:pyruvate kinase n=1 Tax=Noviherbaspirillum sp. Root189 TaxID=1736487 RepID=UPI0009E8E252|nr:pyruvate kinase [Noviherbaspirillum sp. Root189]
MNIRLNARRGRNTKILATLGPASSEREKIRELYESGADVFRLNFSHGTHDDHRKRYEAIRDLERETGRPIGILLDLQGPKLRLGRFAAGKQQIEAGQAFRLDLDPSPGCSRRAPLLHPEIFSAIKPGHDLLIDDGKVRLRIVSCSHNFAETIAINGGMLSDRKGVNVPGSILPLSALTEKDREDLSFGLELGVDWIALSFVQCPDDLIELKSIVDGRARVMAKLEKPSAIDFLDAIIEQADGIMVARGDLGVELPAEQVPLLQKRIVRACREAGKPVVVATQMLESMISSPTPTRAEASDVATAVYDGVDAVMLSAESASGSFPIEAVSMMDRIIKAVESDPLQRKMMNAVSHRKTESATDAICAAIRTVADVLPVVATVAYTSSGATTLRVAHERPRTPILSLTPNVHVSRWLTLIWGIHSVCASDVCNIEEMVDNAVSAADLHGFSVPMLPLVVVAGTPFGVSGSTNLMRIVWPNSVAANIAGVSAEEVHAKTSGQGLQMRDPYFEFAH